MTNKKMTQDAISCRKTSFFRGGSLTGAETAVNQLHEFESFSILFRYLR